MQLQAALDLGRGGCQTPLALGWPWAGPGWCLIIRPRLRANVLVVMNAEDRDGPGPPNAQGGAGGHVQARAIPRSPEMPGDHDSEQPQAEWSRGEACTEAHCGILLTRNSAPPARRPQAQCTP